MEWSKEREDLLRQLWAEKPFRSYTLIARAMGGFEHTRDEGRSAIGGKASRLGLPKRGTHTKRAGQNRAAGFKRGRYRKHQDKGPPKPVKGPVRPGTIKLFGQYAELSKTRMQQMLRQAVLNTGGKLVVSGT